MIVTRPRVVLTSIERRLALAVGTARQAAAVSLRLQNRRVCQDEDDGGEIDLRIHVQGAGAEIAAARVLNVFPILGTDSPDGGIDLVIGGWTVDVKTTHHERGVLFVRPRNAKRPEHLADVFVLMVGTLQDGYECAGWVNRDEIVRPDTLGPLGRESDWDVYQLGQGVLRPIEDLLG